MLYERRANWREAAAMSRWRVLPARPSLASVIALPVSSESRRTGGIASRQGSSAATVSSVNRKRR